MHNPTLVIMAAGMGSRYGGLKQIDPIGKNGELLIDYSIYDAIAAGFKKIVFIISKKNEKDFREVILNRLKDRIETQVVFQTLESMLPEGVTPPEHRTKPWGTGHAVLCCKDVVKTPFAVINADDYYGAYAFKTIYDILHQQLDDDVYRWCMVGYKLENTLTENGHVARGVCEIGIDDELKNIVERVRIEKRPNGAVYTEDDGQSFISISPNTVVSMNMWGFTPSIFSELESAWPEFLEKTIRENPEKGEYFLPNIVGKAIRDGRAKVQVLPSPDRWYGVTYREDKASVQEAIAQMVASGKYPQKLI